MKPKRFRAPENFIFIIALACILALCACSSSSEKSQAALPGEKQVLATVNGSDITAYDLDQAVRTSLGKAAQGMLDEKGRKSVLESLVAARAISQVQEKDLTGKEKAALAKQVAAYREQLLVKMYLARHTQKEPVSQKMVQQYYQQHREQFGAKTIKHYELITSQSALSDTQRDKLLAALQNPDKQKDWSAWSKELQKKGLPVVYKSGRVDPAVLSGDLKNQLAALAPAKPAALAFSSGVINLVRVLGEQKIPPRPLNEVSAQIRKTLLPVQLKKAVKQASDQVLAEAEVEYVKQ